MPILNMDTANVQGANGKAYIVNQDSALVVTESLSTAAGATLTYVISSAVIDFDSVVFVQVQNKTNSAGDPSVSTINTQSVLGQATISIVNRHASAAFNGSLIISIVVFN